MSDSSSEDIIQGAPLLVNSVLSEILSHIDSKSLTEALNKPTKELIVHYMNVDGNLEPASCRFIAMTVTGPVEPKHIEELAARVEIVCRNRRVYGTLAAVKHKLWTEKDAPERSVLIHMFHVADADWNPDDFYVKRYCVREGEIGPEYKKDASNLNDLIKAIEAGNYDARPTELKQGCT